MRDESSTKPRLFGTPKRHDWTSMPPTQSMENHRVFMKGKLTEKAALALPGRSATGLSGPEPFLTFIRYRVAGSRSGRRQRQRWPAPAQTIQLERVRVGYGRRPYFVCPLTGQRCLVLYHHILFASADALGLSRASRTAGRVARWRAVANRADARLTGIDGRLPARPGKSCCRSQA